MGFAAETHDLATRATRQAQGKNIDLMVGNDVSAHGVGFDHDTNAVTILGSERDVSGDRPDLEARGGPRHFG